MTSNDEIVTALRDRVVPFPSPLPPEREGDVLDRMVPGRAEVVLLGESTHGTEEFYRLRRSLTRHLVMERGFRAVLLEAEWPDMYCVNQHLTRPDNKSPYPSVAAAVAQSVRGHGKHMWANREAIALFEWIKRFNESQQYRPDSMVYVFGIDCQQIYRSLNVLYVALADVDFALCSELRARLSFFNGHSEDEHEYASKTVRGIGSERIPEILQTILSEFQWKHFDRLKAKLPPDRMLEVLNIEQNLEVLVNAEEYFRKRVLEPAGSNVSWNTRDQHMALTVGRIRERLQSCCCATKSATTTSATTEAQQQQQQRASLTKVVVWAHNSHIGNAAATSRGGSDFTRNENWNLGQMVGQVTDRCFALGFDTFHGTVTALAGEGNSDGATRTFDLRPAIDGSSENLCHRVCESLGCDAFLLPLDDDDDDDGMSGQLREALSSRVQQRYVGINYHAENEMRSHYIEGSLVGQYGALCFVDRTSALRVLTAEELRNDAGLKASSKQPAASSNKYGVRRLMQEYVRLRRHPISHIRVASEEENLHKCHFLLTFDSGPYAGGEYHGLLDLPNEYPMAPPRISFYTPSGRFETGKRVCVSFSDYHPELWNPSWGIESVLVGLQSFMQEECPEALGSIMSSASKRRKLAEESHAFNMTDQLYQNLFTGENKDEEAFGGEAEEKKDEEDLRCCRYCRMPGGDLVSPCDCKGSNEFAHLECLAKWQYQAILSQSTHPKYQTELESVCNVCGAEFRIKQYSREKLVLSFTGAEMANMVARGCLLVATERSSKQNVRLMEQYEYLRDKLVHWTNGVFLITEIMTSSDGKKQSIVGVNLTNEIGGRHAVYNARALAKLGLHQETRTYIGGPVSPDEPFVLFAAHTSKLRSPSPNFCWSVLQDTEGGDLSVWFVSSCNYISQALSWAGDAVIETRLFWGCAVWDRVQLLGEIARGGWGLATGQVDAWSEPTSQCWQSTVKRAIFAGTNAMSKLEEEDSGDE